MSTVWPRRLPELAALLWFGLGCESEPLEQPPAMAGGNRTLLVFDRARISSDEQAENVRVASTAVDFGTDSVSRATLRVELESPCFPFEGWQEQEIPEGHNWPITCDAFDRAFSVSLGDSPGLELLRAVTPFGGPLSMQSDVTDVVNGLPGAHRLDVAIDTWGDPDGLVSGAKGEWIVTISFELEPGPAPRRVLAIVPLFLDSQIELSSPPLPFMAPENASRGRIEFRATGHGSVFDRRCGGAAEEFCSRTHSLLLDGVVIDEFEAWRDDCEELCTPAHYEDELGSRDYCAENPCGAPDSVRASRANWCPGSVTPPRVVESAELAAPGPHAVHTTVSELTEGGSWRVSLSYFAFE